MILENKAIIILKKQNKAIIFIKEVAAILI